MFMCTADAPENPAPDSADGLHHQRGFGDPQPRAAVVLRHRDAQPAGLRDRPVEILRKTAFPVALEPVLRIEARAQASRSRRGWQSDRE